MTEWGVGWVVGLLFRSKMVSTREEYFGQPRRGLVILLYTGTYPHIEGDVCGLV